MQPCGRDRRLKAQGSNTGSNPMRDLSPARWNAGAAVVTAWLAAFGVSADAHELRIEHVTIVSPERSSPLRDATVSIRDDRIVSISAPTKRARSPKTADRVIDGRGLYLVPGLIDSHVHVNEVPGMTAPQEQAHPDIARAAREQIPRSYLYFGFTTLVDLISTPAQVADWNAHETHPDLYFCAAAPIMDGYPMSWSPKPQRYQPFPYMLIEPGEHVTVPAGFDQSKQTPQAVVARIKADGATCIKSFFERGFGDDKNLPVPQLDTIRTLVQAAHEARMPVFLHANGAEAQAFALKAGVDAIAHGLWHWGDPAAGPELTPATKQVLDGVLESRMGWQPTLQVLYGELDLFEPSYLSDPQLTRVLPAGLIEWYRSAEGQWFHDVLNSNVLPKDAAESNDAAAKRNAARTFFEPYIARNRTAMAYLAKHDARFLFGTDTPSAPTYANPPGLNAWLEMRRLVEAGLTPGQIFRAATLNNAEAVGLGHEIGTVQAGKRANLLLLRRDPTVDIQAYDDIASIILHGRVFAREEFAADGGREPPKH